MFKKTHADTDQANAQADGSRVPLGNRDRRLLSETILIEEELVPPFVRPVLVMVTLIVLSFLVWASLTDLTEVAIAPGEIIPSGEIKVVQHLDGGAIAEINVDEHTLVDEGQVLLRVDGSQALSDLQQMEARIAALRLRAERLSAFAEERSPDFSAFQASYPGLVADQQEILANQLASRQSTLDILDRQIDQQKRRLEQLRESLKSARKDLALTDELVKMREDLAARKLINRTVMLETRRAKVTADGEVTRIVEELDLVSQTLAEVQSRRLDTENQLRRDALGELGTARAELAETEKGKERLQARVDRLMVRAPVRGYVHNLQVKTVGQVIQPGAVLMEIVPDGVSLEAEVRISPRDVGYVKVGQKVNLRVSSYDYSRFGFATGSLKRITASNVVDKDGQSYFRGWVTVDKSYLGDDPNRYVLLPGMAVEAEIRTGEKTLMAYLTKPVTDVISTSFRER